MGKRRRTGAALLIVAAVSLVVSLGYTRHSGGQPGRSASDRALAPRAKNILVMGVDKRQHDAGRSDTLILLRINGTNNTVHGVSIPRDSMVMVPGHGFAKVNSSYGFGGPQLVTEAVEGALGVKVDAYVSVDFQKFEKLIDGFGGVKLTVERDMQYVDKAGKLNIDIRKGTQILDGATALGFVRFRHDNLADLGRIGRQQEFMTALASKLAKPGVALSALRTLDETNLTPGDLLGLLPALRNRATYSVSFETAPGGSVRLKSGWYYILDANSAEARTALGMDSPDGMEVAGRPVSPGVDQGVTVTPLSGIPNAVPASPTGGLGAQ